MVSQPISPKPDFVKMEHRLLDWWYKSGLVKKYLQKNRRAKKRFSFLDGPITANNPMGVHHAWGRTLKDLYQRYHNMKGERQRFQNGFDCQGLWVEVEVEKELGFKNKQDIEKYGLARFVKKCVKRVEKYSKIQTEQSKRLGYFMDWENSYYTMSDENNYMIWHFLKKCHQNGWLYKGRDVVPWCDRCVDGSSKVLLSNGLSKSMKELMNSWKYHKVLGFAEQKNKMVVAPIKDYITLPKEPIFKLSTLETDRSILATADHPFWVKEKGWVPLNKIDIGEKVAVYPHPEIFEDKPLGKKILDEKDLNSIVTSLELKKGKKRIGNKISHYRDLVTIDKWVLDKKIRSLRAQNCTLREIQKKLLLEEKVKASFNAICQVNNTKKKNRTLEYVIQELKNRDLLPLTTKNQKLLIVSRLLGHVFGDGFLSLSSGKRVRSYVGFTGEEEDLNEIKKDLDELKFSYRPIRKEFIVSTLGDRVIRGYSTEFRVNSLALFVLLAGLGAPIGKKSRTCFEVPKWLFEAPKHIIREFLAAYFGSELDKIKIYRKKKFDTLKFSLNKEEKLVKSGRNFVRQISELLKRSNVEIQRIRVGPNFIRKDGSRSLKIVAIFSASKENLLNFCKFVGYRYSKEREEMARYVQEYLELWKKSRERKMEQHERIFGLKGKGLTIEKISEKLHLPKRKVQEVLSMKSRSDVRVHGLPAFRKWLKESTDNLTNPFVWETVKEIKKIGARETFDISVNPLHSFVVNGFVSHNCGTAISQHEILTADYKELTHKAVYLKFPIHDREGEYLLIWTTTPWTLSANVAVAVHPELSYVKIKENKEIYYLSEETRAFLKGAYKVLKKLPGKNLVGLTYQGPFDELPVWQKQKTHHKVVPWKEVSEEEGTGLVHVSTGSGPEDYDLGKKLGLPVFKVLNEAGRYVESYGFLTGKKAREVVGLIFESLKKKGFVYKIHDFTHRYPVCWRCGEELVFNLVDEWYIGMDKKSKIQNPKSKNRTLRERMIEVAKKIRWIPEWGLERELDWLKNMEDWLISKKRYWGLALPIWECKNCGNFEVIGSKEELKKRAVEGWKRFEGHTPHRPWVDKIKIKCKKCKSLMERIPEVGNPWLDAGIVSFSTLKYRADKRYWKKWFPADLVLECFPGQFKNWFYSLIAMSTVLEDTNPFKVCFGHALVKDEKGEEMHKSKGNVIWFDEAAEKMGVDVMRWIYAKQNPVLNLNLSYHLADKTRRRFHLILWNVYRFFKMLLPIQRAKSKNVLDRWIISRLHQTIKSVTQSLENYDNPQAANTIEYFVHDLSTWYVRRSREREDKDALYQTLSTVLVNLSQLLAPFTPFLADEIYRDMKGKKSVHLENWPKPERVNRKLLTEMELVRQICELGHRARKAVNIKVRQPLRLIEVKTEGLVRLKGQLVRLIKDELNVKEVKFIKGKELKVKLDTEITPKLKAEGEARELVRKIQNLRKKKGCQLDEKITVYAPSWPRQFEDYIKTKTLTNKLVKGKKLAIK